MQVAPQKAQIEANLNRVAEAAVLCSSQGADLVLYPETALSGYFLEGGVEESALTSMELVSRLSNLMKGLTRECDVAVGFYERQEGNIYNSCAHIHFLPGGAADLLHVHRKFFLATYGVFQDDRFVSRGREIKAYETRFGKMAMLICEDLWHSITPAIAALKGAETILAPAASPARGFAGETFSNLESYRQILQRVSAEHGVWTINSMLVGFEGGKGFIGGSMTINPFGKIVAESPGVEEHILMSEIDLDEITVARQQSPLLADLSSVLEDVAREFDEVNNSECQIR